MLDHVVCQDLLPNQCLILPLLITEALLCYKSHESNHTAKDKVINSPSLRHLRI